LHWETTITMHCTWQGVCSTMHAVVQQ
jgi:hypothetical protein